MKPKEILVFGASGQIGRHLLRKLTRKNFKVTVVTRNIHEKGHKINQEVFPSTPAEPYWTSDKNYWSKERYWTVNFFTGFSFSRFTGSKPLASRFVKDR